MRIAYKSPTWNFLQHLVEMTIAMFVGMFVLGMPAGMLFDALGWTALNDEVVPSTLLMATSMSIGMATWMRIRGCGWPAIAEMSLAMFVPFVLMYPFYWGGLASGDAVMMVGHVLMVPAMVVAMLFRLNEYTHAHKRVAAQSEA
jgi:flagellar biosynthetic protein FliP